MGKIRLKDLRPGQGDRRLAAWEVIKSLQLSFNKIERTNNGFAIIAEDGEIEKMINADSSRKFLDNGFETNDSPLINAKRTLVLTGVDEFVLINSDDEILAEFERVNQGMKVSRIIRLPNNMPVMKVKLDSVSMVQTSLINGIKLFSQHFPPRNLSQDVFVHIPQCMRCYSYEHVRKDCDKGEDFKICSSCSSAGHRYDKCSSGFLKCLSCGGEHPTMAARCPTRKAFVKTKTAEIRSAAKSGRTSYASAASTSAPTTTSANAPSTTAANNQNSNLNQAVCGH